MEIKTLEITIEKDLTFRDPTHNISLC